jgi:hypothetical protein
MPTRLAFETLFLYAAAILAAPLGTWADGSRNHYIVTLKPVAANKKGEVLFRSMKDIDDSQTEAGDCVYTSLEFGWLVVSASGTWIEKSEGVITPKVETPDTPQYMKGGKEAWDEYEKQHDAFCKGIDWKRKVFHQPFNWKSPPPVVKEILDKHGFFKSNAVQETLGKGKFIWRPKDGVVQKSVQGLKSIPEIGSAHKATFFHAGIALMNNENCEHWAASAEDLGCTPGGARFPISGFSIKKEDGKKVRFESDYITHDIDGIAIVGTK